MTGLPLPLQILGTGEFVPGRRVASAEFDRRWGKDPGWTFEHTGVASRAYLEPGDDVITMGVAAAQVALHAAGLDAGQLDAIISVGSVPYQAIPCTATFLQRALGLKDSGIAAFDVNSTCLGFIVALDLVAQAIATGRFCTVLIVASEPASLGLNWDDPYTAGLFGDGAAAVVVGKSRRPEAAIRGSHVQTFSSGLEYCQIRAGGTGLHPRLKPDQFMAGTVFEMQGKHTYRLAAELLPAFLATLLSRAGVRTEEIEVWVPHQASGRALNHLRRALRLPEERLITILETSGNQVSVSLPAALHRGVSDGRIRPGTLVAMVGSGAGLSFGGVVLQF